MHATDDEVRDRFEIPLNHTPIHFRDSRITGRQALVAASLTPPSEHQLILVRNRRTHLIGIDDEIDLRSGGALRAFPGDRSYTFTTDEIGQVWGAATMAVDELQAILELPEDRELVLERDNVPDTVLLAGGTLSFEPGGVEDILSRPRQVDETVLVTVFTTGGTFPAEGAARIPATTLISEVLARAAHKLGLADTATWVPTVDGRSLVASASFADNGLTGTVEIEWNPPEGGGGSDA